MENKEDYFIEVKTSFTDKLLNKSANQISIEYSNMTLVEHLSFVSEILNKLEIDLVGEGMEVAAGTAVFSCSLTRLYPNIKKIYALDIVEDVVNKLQPKTIEETNMTGRVIPMVGDFNDIKIANGSLDFVVGFNSFHHSNDLKKTLSEVSRILKPGGKLIFFDRVHPNHLTRAQENHLLNQEYKNDYKIQHGLRADQSYTRAEEGEHELRLSDWYTAFSNTGLSLESIVVFTERTFWRFLKILASFIPYFIRSPLNLIKNLSSHPKILLYYLFPFLGGYGKLKIFTLHTKLKTPAMVNSMGHHTIFISYKIK